MRQNLWLVLYISIIRGGGDLLLQYCLLGCYDLDFGQPTQLQSGCSPLPSVTVKQATAWFVRIKAFWQLTFASRSTPPLKREMWPIDRSDFHCNPTEIINLITTGTPDHWMSCLLSLGSHVGHFGPDWNISATVGRLAMKIDIDICISLSNDLGGLLFFFTPPIHHEFQISGFDIQILWENLGIKITWRQKIWIDCKSPMHKSSAARPKLQK